MRISQTTFKFFKPALLFSLVFAIFSFIILAFSTSPAHAASVSFEGGAENFVFHPDSTAWGDTDLFSNLKSAMPGDTLTDTIQITNHATDHSAVQLFLRAEPHNSSNSPVISTEPVVSMNDFLAQLTLRVYNGTTLIYESTADQSATLTDDFSLGLFNYGDSATINIELVVPSSLDNTYAHRTGEVDWIFTAVDNTTTPRSADTGQFTFTGSTVGDIIAVAALTLVIASIVYFVYRHRSIRRA